MAPSPTALSMVPSRVLGAPLRVLRHDRWTLALPPCRWSQPVAEIRSLSRFRRAAIRCSDRRAALSLLRVVYALALLRIVRCVPVHLPLAFGRILIAVPFSGVVERIRNLVPASDRTQAP